MGLLRRLITLAMHHKVSRANKPYQRRAGQKRYVFHDAISLKWMDLHHLSIYHKEVQALRIPLAPLPRPTGFGRFFLRGMRQAAVFWALRSLADILNRRFNTQKRSFLILPFPAAPSFDSQTRVFDSLKYYPALSSLRTFPIASLNTCPQFLGRVTCSTTKPY